MLPLFSRRRRYMQLLYAVWLPLLWRWRLLLVPWAKLGCIYVDRGFARV